MELLVQHTWKRENTDAVVNVVKKIVGMAQGGQLPAGFALRSVNVVAGEGRAFCNWQAPSRQALVDLVGQVNPPTEHAVFELQKMY